MSIISARICEEEGGVEIKENRLTRVRARRLSWVGGWSKDCQSWFIDLAGHSINERTERASYLSRAPRGIPAACIESAATRFRAIEQHLVELEVAWPGLSKCPIRSPGLKVVPPHIEGIDLDFTTDSRDYIFCIVDRRSLVGIVQGGKDAFVSAEDFKSYAQLLSEIVCELDRSQHLSLLFVAEFTTHNIH